MATKEPQYGYLVEKKNNEGFETLGLMTNGVWDKDPKRMAFYLSRYKFVAKILEGKREVLEVGCGDAFGSRIVSQLVQKLTVSDFDPVFLEDAKSRKREKWPMEFAQVDFTRQTYEKVFDAIYLLDVFEHISPHNEIKFIENMMTSLNESGVLIIGIPSLESQAIIAEELRDPGHVNCKSGNDFKQFMLQFFNNVFMFSMNDEVVHTGHHKMAHYLFAVCTGKNET